MRKNELITTKIEKWDATVSLEERIWSITYLGKGGAIISGSTYKVAEKKFIRAMRLSEFIGKILMRK